MNTFTPKRQGMISAIGEQERVKQWECRVDGSGMCWLWPKNSETAGEMIHCGYPEGSGKPHSDGYGGRVMKFRVGKKTIALQGPWHSNDDALLSATGVDLRGTFRTFGVIARGIKHNEGWSPSTLTDVIYQDPDGGVIGRYSRIQDMAQKLADDTGTTLYYYQESRGGSSCGSVNPKNGGKNGDGCRGGAGFAG